MYDPKLGRFLSEDPSGMSDGPNVYTYAHNDPVNGVDPNGLSRQAAQMGVASPDPLWSALARMQSPTSSPEALRANLLAKTPDRPVYSEPWTPRGFTHTAEWPEVPEWASGPRVSGTLQISQAIGEYFVAAGLAGAPEPTMATKVGAVALAAHATDTLNAGWNAIWSNDFQETFSAQGARAIAPHVFPGGTEDTAAFFADAGPAIVGAAMRNAAYETLEVSFAHNQLRGGAYLLRDPETGGVMRTGRSGDLLRRQAEHFRDPAHKAFDFEPIYRTDVYAEQRGLEQLLHDLYNPPLNRINPISPKNPNRSEYMDAAERYLRQ
jgi:hypothetical protein